MEEVKFKKCYRVDLIEHDLGRDSEVYDSKYFVTDLAASNYVKSYNDTHNPPLAGQSEPDWYMSAEGPHLIDPE